MESQGTHRVGVSGTGRAGRENAHLRPELTQINPRPIDRAGVAAYAGCMIRLAANLIVSGVALVSLVTSGWACGLTPSASQPSGEGVAVSTQDMSAMPGNAMRDCQGEPADDGLTVTPCMALRTANLTGAPLIVRTIAAERFSPYYPAPSAFLGWLVQPEPYPPRS